MPLVLCSHRPVIMIVLSFLLVGCAAHHKSDPSPHQQAETGQSLPTVPPLAGTLTANPDEPRTPRDNAVPSATADRQSIQRGKTLFHGKAGCVGCHGAKGQGTNRFDSDEPTFALPPTDLRTPSEKSVRQLYLIVKYGIPATDMSPLRDRATFSHEDILSIMAYLLDLQGRARPLDLIASQSVHPHTDTDVAIATLCEQEDRGEFDRKEHCEDRYAKRYLDLLIGRPPDIALARYAEIETICKHVAYKDLDTLELCYRAEYTASRPAPRKLHNDQQP
jgi:mono/diheme cytochrome c family protein